MAGNDYGGKRDSDFASVMRQIWRCVHDFARRHGGDREDLFQDAALKWCEAYPRYDPTRGASLNTWTVRVVRNRLKDIKKAREALFRSCTQRMPEWAGEEYAAPAECASVFDDLTGDTLTLARLLKDPPAEVLESRKNPGARSTMKAVRRYLEGLGWSAERLEAAVAGGA